MATIHWTQYLDGADVGEEPGEIEQEHTLPARWAICDTCDGDGRHSRHLGAFTEEDLDQQDPDFLERYVGGDYDRTCESCHGTGKVLRVDEGALKARDPELYAAWRTQTLRHARWDAEDRATRRLESGGYDY